MATRRGGRRLTPLEVEVLEAAWSGIAILLLAVLVGAGPIPSPSAIGQTTASPSQSAVATNDGEALVAKAKFEVASIRPFKPFGRSIRRMMDRPNDGRLYATGVTVKALLENAYDVEDAQVVGGPNWINSERFDIQAEADSATDAELRKLSFDQAIRVKERMVQELLADRFGLKVHHETKDLPIYALLVAKHGPRLQQVDKPTPPPGIVGGPPGPKGSPVRSQRHPGDSTIFASYTSMPRFAQNLSRFLGRTVLDRTGLTGDYSFSLSWTPEPGEVGFAMPNPGSAVQSPGAGPVPPPDFSGPSIFTALQEQLGLKLQPEKGPVDVLVIDHIEQPSEN